MIIYTLFYYLYSQSHISENSKEIEYVLEMNPCCTCYSDVYEKCGMFEQKVSREDL